MPDGQGIYETFLGVAPTNHSTKAMLTIDERGAADALKIFVCLVRLHDPINTDAVFISKGAVAH
jgi:hypothetical protein